MTTDIELLRETVVDRKVLMKPYAETKVFTNTDLFLHQLAVRTVHQVPNTDATVWRCHELARAVAQRFYPHHKLQVVDGKFWIIEHSWLLTPDGAILDCYVPGAMPQVQLIDPFVCWGTRYVNGPERTDIRADEITRLLAYFGQHDVPF